MSDSTSVTFNVVQCNAFLRPYVVSHDGQYERMGRIPEALAGLNGGDVDAITFCEVDYEIGEAVPIGSLTETKKLTDEMLAAFAKLGFSYHTQVLPRTGLKILNGGVLIVSKWPIDADKCKHITYDASDGEDGLAAKGVMYAPIEKNVGGVSKTFHVFATHMQAWYSADAIDARARQAAEFAAFVDGFGFDKAQPVLFAGDFNTDLVLYPEEFESLKNKLHGVLPTLSGDQKFTSDPSSNLLVGRDGGAKSCNDGYESSWGPKTDKNWTRTIYTYNPTQTPAGPDGPADSSKQTCANVYSKTVSGKPIMEFFRQSDTDPNIYLAPGGCYCPCCPHEWLDYVLYSGRHLQPVGTPTLECLPIKTDATFKIPWSGLMQPWAEPEICTYIKLTDLSDHYPVIARFRFPI